MRSRPIGNLLIDSLSNRFCYWQGEDGERYLFSQIPMDDIANFSDCVLLLATEENTNPKVHWVGEISDLTPMALRDISVGALAHISVYVHLLSGSKIERDRVIANLAIEAGRETCRLTA